MFCEWISQNLQKIRLTVVVCADDLGFEAAT